MKEVPPHLSEICNFPSVPIRHKQNSFNAVPTLQTRVITLLSRICCLLHYASATTSVILIQTRSSTLIDTTMMAKRYLPSYKSCLHRHSFNNHVVQTVLVTPRFKLEDIVPRCLSLLYSTSDTYSKRESLVNLLLRWRTHLYQY